MAFQLGACIVNAFAVKQIENMQMRCKQHNKGCAVTIALGKDGRAMLKHIDECGFVEVPCDKLQSCDAEEGCAGAQRGMWEASSSDQLFWHASAGWIADAEHRAAGGDGGDAAQESGEGRSKPHMRACVPARSPPSESTRTCALCFLCLCIFVVA